MLKSIKNTLLKQFPIFRYLEFLSEDRRSCLPLWSAEVSEVSEAWKRLAVVGSCSRLLSALRVCRSSEEYKTSLGSVIDVFYIR